MLNASPYRLCQKLCWHNGRRPISNVQKLSKIARVQPHVAYYAFTHGLIGKWAYFLCTIPDVSDLLEPLEATITGEFIPAITGRSVGELERKLLSLPVRLGLWYT